MIAELTSSRGWAGNVPAVAKQTQIFEVGAIQGTGPHDVPSLLIKGLRTWQTNLCANYVPSKHLWTVAITKQGSLFCSDNVIAQSWTDVFTRNAYEGTTLPFVLVIHQVRRDVSGADPKGGEHGQGPAGLIDQVQVSSALTLEELSPLLGVTRRSVQHWRTGRPISARNEHRLRKLVDVFALIPREDPESRRNRIFERHPAGVRAYDLLAEGQFSSAYTLMTGQYSDALTDAMTHEKLFQSPLARLSIMSDGPAGVLGKVDVRRSTRLKRQG
jgi:hypothetical protein